MGKPVAVGSSDEEDPTSMKPFVTPEEPGLVFTLRPILTTPWNFAVDRSMRPGETGEGAFDRRMFLGWLCRFGTEHVEGLPGEIELQETIRIMTGVYQLLSTTAFDRIDPKAVVAVGEEVLRRASLTADQKKTSGASSTG